MKKISLFLTNLCNQNGLPDFKNEMSTEPNRAEKLSNQYALAGYYPLMFSFHQYFNSSYRARQGKVLEEILKNIVRNFADCDRVPDKTSEMRAILSESFQMNIPKLDIDVFHL